MQTWRHFWVEMEGTKYNFSSVQINLPEVIANKIIAWGDKKIPERDVYQDEPGLGRENEIHTTVLYGLHTDRPDIVSDLLKKEQEFEIKLGPVSIFDTNTQYDVVKIEVEGKELHRINTILTNNCKHTNKFKKYSPHVTIAYIRKDTCKRLNGNKTFTGITIPVKEMIFSSMNGKKTKFNLKQTSD